MIMAQFFDWVKRLGQWHLCDVSADDSDCLCGQICLGNNYARVIPEAEREKCQECFRIAEERGLL